MRVRWSAAALVLLSSALSACEARVTSIGAWTPSLQSAAYWEAEAGELSGGFAIGEDERASAGKFLQPPDVSADDAPGDARALYTFSLSADSDYVFWGRIHSPDASTNRFWFRVDDGEWSKWRISVGDIWYWDALHEDANYGMPLHFTLARGEHRFTIANCVPGAELDRLYVTSGDDTPPGNDTPCNPPHSIEIDGSCAPSCGSQRGNACGASACAGRPLLTAYDCDICCKIE